MAPRKISIIPTIATTQASRLRRHLVLTEPTLDNVAHRIIAPRNSPPSSYIAISPTVAPRLQCHLTSTKPTSAMAPRRVFVILPLTTTMVSHLRCHLTNAEPASTMWAHRILSVPTSLYNGPTPTVASHLQQTHLDSPQELYCPPQSIATTQASRL